jgi:flagellin-like protein
MRSLSISIARSRKAVSPVIATIIIVAIAISIAIAVAYWMVGITGAFTRFEKLEFVSAYASAQKINNQDGYNISMTVKNTGTTDVTVNMIFINGKPAQDYSSGHIEFLNGSGKWDMNFTKFEVKVNMGETKALKIWLSTADFKAGQSVEITLHTAAGKDYPKNVVLP